jgi:ATP-dependent RNA helicase DHX36
VVRLVDSEGSVSIEDFLGRALEPPVPHAVQSAINVLQGIGAMTDDERLTILGVHLASLPISPQLGKLLLYGLLFNCLDPILTVACAMSYRCD